MRQYSPVHTINTWHWYSHSLIVSYNSIYRCIYTSKYIILVLLCVRKAQFSCVLHRKLATTRIMYLFGTLVWLEGFFSRLYLRTNANNMNTLTILRRDCLLRRRSKGSPDRSVRKCVSDALSLVTVCFFLRRVERPFTNIYQVLEVYIMLIFIRGLFLALSSPAVCTGI